MRSAVPMILVTLASPTWAAEPRAAEGELMNSRPSSKQGLRLAHPKGTVCQGSFEASPMARSGDESGQLRGGTDVVAISHNGFVVGTGKEFLALLKASAATDPSTPQPSPIRPARPLFHPRSGRPVPQQVARTNDT